MKTLVVGNWKMNGSGDLLNKIAKALHDAELGTVEVVVCPPSVFLKDGKSFWAQMSMGGQDCSHEEFGAFTGEVSPAMLKACGAKFVLVGHSERRTLHKETNLVAAKKAKAAQNAGLKPILCIGEALEQRQAGRTFDVLEDQLAPCLKEGVDFRNLVIAYEPVWSIGTGQNAGIDEIREAVSWIYTWLAESGDASDVRILYGGSVKPANATKTVSIKNVGGLLVGGASLDPDDFKEIARAAHEIGTMELEES